MDTTGCGSLIFMAPTVTEEALVSCSGIFQVAERRE